jgi:hypothetical protein
MTFTIFDIIRSSKILLLLVAFRAKFVIYFLLPCCESYITAGNFYLLDCQVNYLLGILMTFRHVQQFPLFKLLYLGKTKFLRNPLTNPNIAGIISDVSNALPSIYRHSVDVNVYMP